jgi:transcriptional regulator with XRE-family HTH domain
MEGFTMTKPTSSTKYGTRAYWRGYGNRLHIVRLALGITDAEAATAYGVTLRTYRRWEAGARQSNTAKPMLSFAKRYGVSLDWLMVGKTHHLSRQLTVNPGGKIAILPIMAAEHRRREAEFWRKFGEQLPV